MDADGAFGGTFTANFETLGVDLRVIPEGAHHEIGTIERHNFSWSRIFDRVVDATSALDEYLNCFIWEPNELQYRSNGTETKQVIFAWVFLAWVAFSEQKYSFTGLFLRIF